ncbi:hypothetical protein AB0L13_41265 [Saccharopolyspora shandongensis]|uniref:hypothetical protein n=1 Tax=Saccharopolyspora shandongensis TaxID=418495 RepID=UPI00342B1AFC
MALRRYRPEDDEISDPAVRRALQDPATLSGAHLGPLLVDLDDLQELAELIRPPGTPDHQPLQIRFETGYATTVQDLRKVADGELARGIEMSFGDASVKLRPDVTKVVGPQLTVVAVKQMWARYRRTQAWPYYGRVFWWGLAFVVLSGAASLLSSILLWDANSDVSARTTLALLIIMALIGPWIVFYARNKAGSAVLFPGNRQQRREDRPLQRRHRFQMTLTLFGSVLVPIISLLTTILVKR